MICNNPTLLGQNNGLNLRNRTGVYFIMHTSGSMYIGSAAKNFAHRFGNHIALLNECKHRNIHLQRAWNKYGLETFEFGVVEDCSPSECIACEQKWIDFFRPEYNIAKIAGSRRGVTHSSESRLKSSLAKLGRKLSDATKARMSVAQKARTAGRKVSPETRAKISNALKGRKPPPQAIEAARLAWMGKKHTEETKKIIGEKSRRPHSAEQNRKVSMAKKGVKFSESAKYNMSVSRKKWWADKKYSNTGNLLFT